MTASRITLFAAALLVGCVSTDTGQPEPVPTDHLARAAALESVADKAHELETRWHCREMAKVERKVAAGMTRADALREVARATYFFEVRVRFEALAKVEDQMQ